MKEFNFNGTDFLEMWLHQNGAEIDDIREGSLVDNYLVWCKNGVAIIYERYLNPWSSGYRVRFARYNTPEEAEIFHEWDRFCDEYEKQCYEIEQEYLRFCENRGA